MTDATRTILACLLDQKELFETWKKEAKTNPPEYFKDMLKRSLSTLDKNSKLSTFQMRIMRDAIENIQYHKVQEILKCQP